MPSTCVSRVVITGACRGFGLALAKAFAGKAQLILCDIEGPALSKLSKTLFYGQLISLAKLLLKIDATSAADIKGRAAPSQG